MSGGTVAYKSGSDADWDVADLIDRMTAEASRIEEDTEHSFKAHYNAAVRWGRAHLWIGLPSALIAAVAGAAAFKNLPELAGALALVSTALTTVLTFLKPSERAELHKTAGCQYQALRNQTRIFREVDLLAGMSVEQARERLHQLARTRDELNEGSPAIARRDYELAKSDIDEGRSLYRADKERS